MAKDEVPEPGKNGKAPASVIAWKMNEDAIVWLKAHRTFVASMSSSVVSTYVAVSEVWRLEPP